METKNILDRLGEKYKARDNQEIKIICLAAFFAIDVVCLLGLIIYAIFF